MTFAARISRCVLAAAIAVALLTTEAAAIEPASPTKITSAVSTLVEIKPAMLTKPSPEPAQGAGTTASDGAEAPVAPKLIPVTLVVDIDLAAQRMIVNAHGKPVHTWAISSGTREFPTPTGAFRPSWMAKMWFSRKYDDAPMPHSVFFKDGAAIHGTQSVSRLGTAASHGCVRLAPSHAATLFGLVSKHGMVATRITVQGTPKWREPMVVSRSTYGSRVSNSETRMAAGTSAYGRIDPYRSAPSAVYAPPSSGFIYPGDGPRYVQLRRPVSINSGRIVSPYGRY